MRRMPFSAGAQSLGFFVHHLVAIEDRADDLICARIEGFDLDQLFAIHQCDGRPVSELQPLQGLIQGCSQLFQADFLDWRLILRLEILICDSGEFENWSLQN